MGIESFSGGSNDPEWKGMNLEDLKSKFELEDELNMNEDEKEETSTSSDTETVYSDRDTYPDSWIKVALKFAEEKAAETKANLDSEDSEKATEALMAQGRLIELKKESAQRHLDD